MGISRTDDIRRAYLEFFAKRGHEIVASDSLVPKDDPSLLFTGAGMNQFKEQFLGRNVTYRRATSSQKCFRTGDLENVGRTSGHHTFFEMLGNFSFGDYFKKEAILWGWEFLTRVLEIDEAKLWVSVYKDDDEAYGVWRDLVKVPARKIVRLGEKDNFWPSEAPSKGPNGPCGPCSEIFYDWGEAHGCGKPDCSPACDCKRFSEIWNLVFTQFDRQSDGGLKNLPNKNIDTGMGLERIAAVMQGVRSNFDIDIFKGIISDIADYGRKTNTKLANAEATSRRRAIADHVRAVTFAVGDGVMPSNEERGYVVRKLVRRSLVYGGDLGIAPPFLYKLVTAVVNAMKAQYPELLERRDDIAQVVKQEEESFLAVLDTQLPKVEEAFSRLSVGRDTDAIAKAAFEFYDTYGMPYDMLEEVAERRGIAIDKGAFDAYLDRQREKSRAKSKIKGEIFTETFAKKVEALALGTEFVGYDRSECSARVLAVMDGGEVILDRTPFYGESGGQVGDRGIISSPTGQLVVEDAKKIARSIVHIGRMSGRMEVGQEARAVIDGASRRLVMRNHTATHLLQAALRAVLGDHVKQTGSLVDRQRLRFDFTHMKKMEPREIARVEEIVNDSIARGLPVVKEVKDLAAAKGEGAMALFGEKYESRVRVVSVAGISKELCGGTHVDNTSEIGLFKITGESSIASGVRRIEAATGDAARQWIRDEEAKAAAQKRQEEEKERAKRSSQERVRVLVGQLDEYLNAAERVGRYRYVGVSFDDATAEMLRALSDAVRAKDKDAIVVLLSRADGKASFVVSVPPDLARQGSLGANVIAKEIAGYLSGSGGGRPDFAQGGGKDPLLVESASERIRDFVKGRAL